MPVWALQIIFVDVDVDRLGKALSYGWILFIDIVQRYCPVYRVFILFITAVGCFDSNYILIFFALIASS